MFFTFLLREGKLTVFREINQIQIVDLEKRFGLAQLILSG